MAIRASLVVTLFTGLTILAFRYPKAYHHIYVPMLGALGAVWASWVIYQFAYTSGFGQAVVETMKLNSPTLIETPSQHSTPWWYFFLPAVVYGYLSFLRLLPLLFSEGGSKGTDK